LWQQHLLLGGATDQYRGMYEKALTAMKRNIFFRPMLRGGVDVLFAGNVDNYYAQPVDTLTTVGEGQHLGCFVGGMVGIGARMFGREEDVQVARKLMEGCLWAYESARGGIMPEILEMIPCERADACPFDEDRWLAGMNKTHQTGTKEAAEEKQREIGLAHGILRARDRRYILRYAPPFCDLGFGALLTMDRPEAIESVFILYRITGDRSLQDRAWGMFNSIIEATLTDIAHAALDDCTAPNPQKVDKMESFWLAETLKYFFLVFSEPDVISLDRYVLNTEAHPLKRP
jgi:mannosyl-oligosaccharide alpha-1,2-mannosidase